MNPDLPRQGEVQLAKGTVHIFRAKLLRQGVRDMVRISDARMSGTAYGTVILHVAPETEAGGPLALVRNGDEIAFDGPNRSLELLVDEAELARRRAAWQKPAPRYTRGVLAKFARNASSASSGAVLDRFE